MEGATAQQKPGSVWELVADQHGVVTRGQLLGLGYSAGAVEHRVRTGRLRPVGRGVYAVGRPKLTKLGVWMAAVLSCGEGAVLSHSSAAALWGIGDEWGRGVEVSVVRSYPRRRGLIAHRRRRLRPKDRAVHEGILLTSPAMTLLDHACRLAPQRMERMINEADRLDLVRPQDLRSYLDTRPHQAGVGRLRRLLDRRTILLTESELEAAFLPIAAAVGLPLPLTGEHVNGFRVDFFWPHLGLVVETDGLRYHRTPAEQARDRLRDQTHTAAGLTPLRFTHDQVKNDRSHVRRVLEATVAQLELRAGLPLTPLQAGRRRE